MIAPLPPKSSSAALVTALDPQHRPWLKRFLTVIWESGLALLAAFARPSAIPEKLRPHPLSPAEEALQNLPQRTAKPIRPADQELGNLLRQTFNIVGLPRPAAQAQRQKIFDQAMNLIMMKGADPNLSIKNGERLEHVAARLGPVAMEFFVKNGGKFTDKTGSDSGLTSAHIAAENPSSFEIYRQLGGPVHERKLYDVWTPAHILAAAKTRS
ncbi:MAG: hypothetical protein AB7U41_04740 [Dongiaceae bacterium]